MRHLMAPENRDLLAQLAASHVLLAFDFDGTLAPIAADRHRAAMRPRTQRLLAMVAGLYPCAVISGRGRADVASRLGDAAVKYVVGNHGLEPSGDLVAIEAEVADARPLLSAALAAVPDVEIEDKRYSLAVHYRRCRHKWRARAAILGAVAALDVRMRVIPGKLVLNLVAAGAPNKGDALVELRTVEGASAALYLGDDVTDEDVFELDQPGSLCTVRVGKSRASRAHYYLRDQREVDRLLASLLALRGHG
jgi:trehalose 6-phosphate phosphatase